MTFKSLFFGTLMALGLATLGATAQAQQANQQAQQLEQLVGLLQQHPEVIGDVLNSVERYIEGKEASRNAQAKYESWLYDNDKVQPWYGAADPKLTVLVYTDYDCPYCKRIEPHLQRLVEEFDGVKVINIVVPLRQQQTEGSNVNPSEFAMNVWQHQPEQYPEVAKLLYAKNGLHTAQSIEHVARLTGTRGQLNNPQVARRNLMENYKAFSDFGYRGTPTIVVGSAVIPGFVEYDQLQALVQEMLD